MEPLDFITQEDLMRFFHVKKTEISCMEEPLTFLNQLRDHNLVPEQVYRKVIQMKCKDRRQEGVYQILDWLEKERGHCVKLFWTCVFKPHILQKYPVLRSLRNSLLDGSFRGYMALFDNNEQDSIQSVKDMAMGQTEGRKRKRSTEATEDGAGPSSRSNCNQKKPVKRPSYSYKSRCSVESEFEKFAGQENAGNWKRNIISQNTPLHKLTEDGHLQSPGSHNPKNQSIQFPVSSLEAQSRFSAFMGGMEGSRNEADGEGGEEEDGLVVDLSKFQGYALKVSCGSVSGVLYKSRFTGSHSKSIRTKDRWFSPEEFVKQGKPLTGGHWETDILCHGKTLKNLMKMMILIAHPSECRCLRCSSDNQLEQDNDDVCFICNSAGDLVCCDECPRSFHHHCHLPVLDERNLGKDWMCTFCVLKTNQQLWIHMTREDVLNSPVSGNVMRCEYLLLCLYKEDVFTCDPTTTVPMYTRVISKPMWLDRVKTKLQNKRYRIMKEFVRDVRLIFHNCGVYNRDNEFGKMGARLSEIFERKFLTVFKIQ